MKYDRLRELSQELHSIYERLGDINRAYEMLKLYQASNDSLLSDKNTRKLVQKETEYTYEKEKEANKITQLQQLNIKQQRLTKQKWMTYIFIVAFVLALILALVFYKVYQKIKKKNLSINEKTKQLQELDHFKSHFFSNISHELRTPLTLIMSPLNKILNTQSLQLDSGTRKSLEMVHQNADNLNDLVNDILDISKLETTALELHPQATDIRKLIGHISDNYVSLMQQLDLNLQIHVDESIAEWISLDQKRIEKILNNLLINSIKFTPAEGQITLEARLEEHCLIIQVRDTGEGINPKDLPYIFDRYHQSEQPNKPLQGGSGIGLALANELTILMKGTLKADSELNKGSTFTLSIPYLETTSPAKVSIDTKVDGVDTTAEALMEIPASAGDNNTILIVEDNLDMQQHLADLLQADYHLVLASNGKKALEKLKNNAIDLIVTDAMMPEMDGFSLVQHLKNKDEYRGIPVVMLTALDVMDKRLEALSIGVDDYLTKPFSYLELKARLHNLLEREEMKREWVREENETHSISDIEQAPLSSKPVVYRSDLEWLKEIEQTILNELENSAFNIADLASTFNLGERQFQRKIKKITGLTPKQFQQETALQTARKLLEKGIYGNLTGVSYAVGISHVSRFSNMYSSAIW